MTPNEAERLAYAINDLRPDWALTSLRTFITGSLTRRAYRDAAVALVWVALDPDTKTPRRVLENGPWWGATLTAASPVERHPSAVPIGDLCDTHGCHRDACPPQCNPQAAAARRRNAQERTEAWAARIRQDLHARQPEEPTP